jgi:hypothetical protein
LKGILERLSIYFGVLAALIVLYVGLMTLTFSYSSKNFESRIAVANAIKEEEGDYPVPLYFKGGAMLDNFTDFLMIGKTVGEEDKSVLFQAMSVTEYERYWHGYLVWLRPLSVFFSLPEIRLILSLLNLSLFIVSLLLIHGKFGFRISVPFALMWFSCFGMVTLGSIQYSTVSLLLYTGVIVFLKMYKPEKKMFLYLFFLIMGSLVNFFDLLTYPLATLTVILALMCIIDIKEGIKTKETVIKCLKSSALWSVSFGFTWVIKWFLGNLITGVDVLKNATEAAKIRSVGHEGQTVDRIKVITDSIKVPLLYEYIPFICIICILVALILKKGKQVKMALPLIMISLYPYIWFEVFCEHSTTHAFFTYRAQMGSIFALATVAIIVLLGINATQSKAQ